MAFPTSVNDQITDAVTASLLALHGSAGATSMSQTHQLAYHALGLLKVNATAAQQRGQTLADAVVAAGVRLINDMDETSGKRSK